MSLPVRALQRLSARSQGDDGLSLLEVIVALMIIAVVMASAAGFFLNSLKTTGGASQRQSAVTLVNQELESIRAVPAAVLVTGRTNSGSGSNSIVPLFTWTGAAALTTYDDLSNSQPGAYNYDKTANASTVPSVPPITTQTLNNKTYTLHNFIDPCWLAVGTAQTADTSKLSCGATYSSVTGTTTSMMFRVTVAATWTGGPATNCTQGCSYSASSLVDPNSDPTFKSNISKPTITGISPSSVAAMTTTNIVVSGAGFVSGAMATVCGNATVGTINQSLNTGTSIQIPIIAGSTTGPCTLQITNPDGGNVSISFTISSAPSITSVSPSTVQNYTSTPITITGSPFVGASITTGSGGSGTWSSPPTTGGSGAAQTLTATYAANAPMAGADPFVITNQDGGTAAGTISVTKSTPSVGIGPVSVNTGSSTNGTLPVSDLAPSGVTVTAARGSVTVNNISPGNLTVTYVAPSTAGSDTLTITNPDGGWTTYTVTVMQSLSNITNVSSSTDGTDSCKTSKQGVKTCKTWTTTFTVSGSGFGTSPSVSFTFEGAAQTATVTSASDTSITFTYAVTTKSRVTSTTGTSYTVAVSTSAGTSNTYSDETNT